MDIKEFSEDFKMAASELMDEYIIKQPVEDVKNNKSSQCKMKVGPLDKIKKFYYGMLEKYKISLETKRDDLKQDVADEKKELSNMFDSPEYQSDELLEAMDSYNNYETKVNKKIASYDKKIDDISKKIESMNELESTVDTSVLKQDDDVKEQQNKTTEGQNLKIENVLAEEVKSMMEEEKKPIEEESNNNVSEESIVNTVQKVVDKRMDSFNETEEKMQAIHDIAKSEIMGNMRKNVEDALKESFRTSFTLYKDAVVDMSLLVEESLREQETNNNEILKQKDTEISNKDYQIKSLEKTIEEQNTVISQKDKEIKTHIDNITRNSQEISELNQRLIEKENQLREKEEALKTKDAEIERLKAVEENYNRVSSVFQTLTASSNSLFTPNEANTQIGEPKIK